jgi:hypothetical protein
MLSPSKINSYAENVGKEERIKMLRYLSSNYPYHSIANGDCESKALCKIGFKMGSFP